MADVPASNIVRQLRFVVAAWKEDPRTDSELLRRFAQTRDEQAFTVLVGRHSELVWGVCLRVLRNPADAEDALQATFLRLARDAKRILDREALGGWLFRVARDCSIDLQRSLSRQRRIEERAAEVARHLDAASSSDLRVLLDDELAQLPRSERDVLVLCCLEGRTYSDAALELGCSTAAVHRRFVRAQTRLRRRFARNGSAATGILSAVLLGSALPSAAAAPPATLAKTVECGLSMARTGVVPPTRAGELLSASTAGVTVVGRSSLPFGAVIAATVCVAVATAALIPSHKPQIPTTTQPRIAESVPEAAPHTPARGLIGTVLGPDGKPVADAKVSALTRRPFGPGERGLRDDHLATVTTDTTGRFTLPVPEDFTTWFSGRVVTVWASHPDFGPTTHPVRLDRAQAEVKLNLTRATALRGRLIDESGLPAHGVRVEVVRVGDVAAEPVVGDTLSVPPEWPGTATTASDGTFELPGLGNTANVWVRVQDPRFALNTFRVEGEKPTDCRLAPARPLLIEVRAGDTGQPLAAAKVTVITDRISAHPHFCVTDHAILGPRSVPADIDAVTDNHGQVRVSLAPGDRAVVLVHPPADAGPYVGVRLQAVIADDGKVPPLVTRIPRGRWVTGTVTDSENKPIAGAAVHWGREDADSPEWKDAVLSGRDAITRTAADGSFKLAVLPETCTIRVYGPTLDYQNTLIKLSATRPMFAHAVARIDADAREELPPIRLSLQTGLPASGTIECSAADQGSVSILASGRVSPVRGYAALPLRVAGCAFNVPGCREGFTTRAYLLNPTARVGGIVDVTPGTAQPALKLLPCGTIRLRIRDANSAPKIGHEVAVALMMARDRRTGSSDELVEDAQPVEWFDAANYPTRPKSGPDGSLELPALIPGARYTIAVGNGANKLTVGTFVIEPGKTLQLPDVVIPEGDHR